MSRYLDQAFGRATASCAFELARVAEAGDNVKEIAHLQPSFRAALKEELGDGVLAGEKLFDLGWNANPNRTLGSIDVVMTATQGLRAAAELKWAGDRETFAWSVFDAVKMAVARETLGAEACYVVVGAPAAIWCSESACQALLTDGKHSTRTVIERYDGKHGVFSDEVAWPHRVPAVLATVVVADAPVPTSKGLWKLRAVRIEPDDQHWLSLSDGMPVTP